jgi:hypothetical protein
VVSREEAAAAACAHLLVLESHEDDLLHQRQLGLLAALCVLADVPRVVCDLVAIG